MFKFLLDNKIIIFIFLLALVIRFLYFPKNIYFGYDQARDAYSALGITHGDLKLIGPTTSFEGLNHGVFYYYLLAPFYFLGGGSPEFVAAALRILNALGVFFVFFIGSILFGRFVGLISSLLYAIAFEQTQFSIYMGNPAPASLTVPLIYLGLALYIFKNNPWGLALSFLALGLSIQLQFALIYLFVPVFLMSAIFYRQFLKLNFKYYLFAFLALIVSLSTFIFAEIKYHFRMLNTLSSLSNFNPHKTIVTITNSYLYTVEKMFKFNLTDDFMFSKLVIILFLLVLISLYRDIYRKQLIFLSIWFFGLIIPFVIHGGSDNLQRDVLLYYPNVGISISLLILVAFLMSSLKNNLKFITLAILIFIVVANFKMITTFNSKGTIAEIDVQQGMLLSDEKKVLDYLYQDAKGSQFAVKAITMPFLINTTWSYLFEWYGKDKYGYLPIWNGKNAAGYPGNITVIEAQEKIPALRYLIMEPSRGIHQYTIDDYIKEENYFTNVVAEYKIGEFVVQKRVKY